MSAHSLLTFEEAAQLIHETVGLPDLDSEWVRSQVDQGKLGAVVVRKKRRVRRDKVLALTGQWITQAA